MHKHAAERPASHSSSFAHANERAQATCVVVVSVAGAGALLSAIRIFERKENKDKQRALRRTASSPMHAQDISTAPRTLVLNVHCAP